MDPTQRNFITGSVKEKIDKAAYAKALIIRGEFDWTGTEWEGKRPPKHADGSLRAPTKVLLRAGGWAETNTNALGNLKCDYFEDRFNYHMQRLDGGFRKALAEITGDGSALEHLATLAWKSLVEDLSDPERVKRIPFKDRADLYNKVTDMDAKIKGDIKTKDPHAGGGLSIGGIVQVVNNHVGETPEGQDILQGLKAAHSDVADIIEGVVEVAGSDE